MVLDKQYLQMIHIFNLTISINLLLLFMWSEKLSIQYMELYNHYLLWNHLGISMFNIEIFQYPIIHLEYLISNNLLLFSILILCQPAYIFLSWNIIFCIFKISKKLKVIATDQHAITICNKHFYYYQFYMLFLGAFTSQISMMLPTIIYHYYCFT
jgi:hypothetical protein